MPRSAHTVLINCVIGFCQSDSETWIHPLSKWNYEPKLVEQEVPLEGGQHVRPDVVAHSEKLSNSLAFDCKGGSTIDEGQMERYRRLTPRDLRVYISPHDENQHTDDVCIVDFESTHDEHSGRTRGLPCLTITATHLKKSGKFKKEVLEKTFAQDIPIAESMIEPSSYYPFSETDGQGVVVKELIRAWIAILQDKKKRDLNVLARETYAKLEVMKIIHPYFDIMGPDHQRALTQRILDLLTYLQREHSDLVKQVFDIQNARFEGKDISVRLANLAEVCQGIIDKEEEKMGLEAFWPEVTRRG